MKMKKKNQPQENKCREKIFSQSGLPRLIHDMRYKIEIINSFKKNRKKT